LNSNLKTGQNIEPNLKNNKYLPLILVEIYLLLTIIVLYFGPVQFKIHNPFLFTVLIFLYHLFFITGYFFGIKKSSFNKVIISKYSKISFFILLTFGILGILITYKNTMNYSTLIPYNFLNDLLRGIQEPAQVYIDRMGDVVYDGAGASRGLNIFFIFIAFCKLLFIFYFIWFWKNLNLLLKIISIFYSFLYISPGIIAGVNSVLFWFILFSFTTLIIFYYLYSKKKLSFLLRVLAILFLIPILSFGNIMSQRGGSFDYFINSSSIGDISVKVNDIDTESSILEDLNYSLVWMNFYVTQGYYGFSLTLDKEFKWTYGFGNSAFLQRQFNMVTGLDIGSDTYQRRNDRIWGEYSMWHSFYGQFANDFSPYGIIILMFLIGWYFAKIWLSVITRNSFYGAAMIPIFTIMFIFFPANNQIFGYIDSISYFFAISIFWFFENYKIKL
jgi:hypothetical protein